MRFLRSCDYNQTVSLESPRTWRGPKATERTVSVADTSLPDGKGKGKPTRARALALYDELGDAIVRRIDGVYLVPSQSNANLVYEVDLERQSCPCKWWKYHRRTCKHLLAAELKHSEEVREAEKLMADVRERSAQRRAEQIRYTPEQARKLMANLEAMGA